MAHMKLGKQKVLTRTKREWVRVNTVNLVPELFHTVTSSVQWPFSQPIVQTCAATHSLPSLIYNNTLCRVCLTPWSFELMLKHLRTPEKPFPHPGAAFSGTRNLKYSWGRADTVCVHICHCTSLTTRPFVVIHTIRQTAIPTLLNSWVTNTSSVQMMRPRKLLFLIVS